jgi:hypothetical protein
MNGLDAVLSIGLENMAQRKHAAVSDKEKIRPEIIT